MNVNDKNYRYEGNKTENEETIVKIIDNQTYNYIKSDNIYYKGTTIMNATISKEEIYNILDYNYLNLNTINKYLSISTEQNDENIVYLKDIILGHESEDYITIKVSNNTINVDYTSLLKVFNKSIEKCIIEYTIEEIE